MNIYSTENIEFILKQLLKKDGMSSGVPEILKSQKEQLKSHRESRKEYGKQLRHLTRQISRLDEDKSHGAEEKKGERSVLSKKIENLETIIQELDSAIEKCEEKWIKTIVNYAKDLLKGLRSKNLQPKIDDFLLFDKKTFKTGDLDSKVLEQLIKDDISKHYKRKPADRNIIIEQLKGLLGNKLPKIIIRADIKSFFESVPMDKLLNKLENDGYVSTMTITYLKQIRKLVKEKGVDGVPRGLAFSSYLTEIYLQRLDDDIRNLPNLYFYQRYVDDMIMLFSVDNNILSKFRLNEGWRLWKSVKGIFEEENLALHEDGEKKCVIYSGKTTKKEFDYLGYKFLIDEGHLTIRLSDHRFDGYKNKINAIFNHYNRTARDNQSLDNESGHDGKRRKRQQPLRRLFGHLSALTGNGMLKGPKSSILTGIYYSNKHVTSLEDLMTLDIILRYYIDCHLEIPDNLFKYDEGSHPCEIRNNIKGMMINSWSFVEGFKNRRFCNNASYFNRLKQIKGLCR